MDEWAWDQLEPWRELRTDFPAGRRSASQRGHTRTGIDLSVDGGLRVLVSRAETGGASLEWDEDVRPAVADIGGSRHGARFRAPLNPS
jgi:hypothetical protein